MSARRLLLGLVVCLVGLSALPAAAQDRRAPQKLYRKALQGAVAVWASGGTASGFLADRDRRWVVTNAHVTGWREEVEVQFPAFDAKGKLIAERSHYAKAAKTRGKVIHVDVLRDLAVVQVESVPETAQALPLAGDDLEPGDPLLLVGNPSVSDALWVCTTGTVRQIYKLRINSRDVPAFEGWAIESQLPTNNGDSGSPVVNEAGEVVGVHRGGNQHGGYDMRIHIYVTEIRTVLAAAAKAPTVPQPATAADLTQRGREYLWSRHFKLALADFDAALKLDPDFAAAYAARAQLWFGQRELVKTIADCTEAIRLNPKLVDAWKFRGMAHAERREPEKAIADYTKALELNPNDAWTYLYRSWMYRNVGDAERAEADYRRAVELDERTASVK
jgi:tetratricopeptide (TPR) repeat protein